MREADVGKAGLAILVFLLVKIGTHSFYTVATQLWNDAWNGKKWKQFLPWMLRSQKLLTWVHTANGDKSPLSFSQELGRRWWVIPINRVKENRMSVSSDALWYESSQAFRPHPSGFLITHIASWLFAFPFAAYPLQIFYLSLVCTLRFFFLLFPLRFFILSSCSGSMLKGGRVGMGFWNFSISLKYRHTQEATAPKAAYL